MAKLKQTRFTFFSCNSGNPTYLNSTFVQVDVRWDWPPSPDHGHDDELMFLLDLIHRKSVKLRSEVEDNSKVTQLYNY